nr:NUDIX hydrolase [uncultured Sellimonas sp.]
MPAFFEDIEAFRGDGSRNEKGETLEEFLEHYDPYRYKNPCCTVDMAVFGYPGESPDSSENLQVLLIRRRNHPSIGDWAMPGGFVNLYENLEESARRELYEETHVQGVETEQIGAFGEVQRDPRARVITTAFMALVRLEDVKAKAGDDAKDAAWFTIRISEERDEEGTLYRMELENRERGILLRPQVCFRTKGTLIRNESAVVRERGGVAADHAAILLTAYLRLRRRMEYETSKKETRQHEME